MNTSAASSQTPIASEAQYLGPERRVAPADRRSHDNDRRHLDRATDDISPRRDPDRYGRRATDPGDMLAHV